jgi:hypothetical protein
MNDLQAVAKLIKNFNLAVMQCPNHIGVCIAMVNFPIGGKPYYSGHALERL